jgi:hypothetical protein
MIVELNDLAFKKAKENDVFVVKIIKGKKYAFPISKDELFEDVYKRLDNLELKYLNFNENIEKQNEENKKHKEQVNETLIKISQILGGKQ